MSLAHERHESVQKYADGSFSYREIGGPIVALVTGQALLTPRPNYKNEQFAIPITERSEPLVVNGEI